MGQLAPATHLQPDHNRTDFDCGEAKLNHWFQRKALQAHNQHTTRVFVVADGQTIAGFYALSSGSLLKERLPETLAESKPDFPIPILLLTRLAVDLRYQGQGLGQELVTDAVRRSRVVIDNAGAVALAAEAMNEEVKGFYAKQGFLQSPAVDRLMVLPFFG